MMVYYGFLHLLWVGWFTEEQVLHSFFMVLVAG